MARLVLADASPLIALARLAGLDWIGALFGPVMLPETVRAEILDRGDWPGQESLRLAIETGVLVVRSDDGGVPELTELDEGEAACIRLALMDEKAGRAVAAEHGITVAGTAAVIGMARQRGLIPSAREAFEELLRGDFRISGEVIRVVLARVGEAQEP
jgi:predicted nucleic acid-binding protein